jgi:hypothetical protein
MQDPLSHRLVEIPLHRTAGPYIGSKAPVSPHVGHFRSTLDSRRLSERRPLSVWAIGGLMRCNKLSFHSINLSASSKVHARLYVGKSE